MSLDVAMKVFKGDPNKLDLILLTLHRLQEDLHVTKTQLKAAIAQERQNSST